MRMINARIGGIACGESMLSALLLGFVLVLVGAQLTSADGSPLRGGPRLAQHVSRETQHMAASDERPHEGSFVTNATVAGFKVDCSAPTTVGDESCFVLFIDRVHPEMAVVRTVALLNGSIAGLDYATGTRYVVELNVSRTSEDDENASIMIPYGIIPPTNDSSTSRIAFDKDVRRHRGPRPGPPGRGPPGRGPPGPKVVVVALVSIVSSDAETETAIPDNVLARGTHQPGRGEKMARSVNATVAPFKVDCETKETAETGKCFVLLMASHAHDSDSDSDDEGDEKLALLNGTIIGLDYSVGTEYKVRLNISAANASDPDASYVTPFKVDNGVDSDFDTDDDASEVVRRDGGTPDREGRGGGGRGPGDKPECGPVLVTLDALYSSSQSNLSSIDEINGAFVLNASATEASSAALSAGAIAGIAIGAVAAVALVTAVVVYTIRRRATDEVEE
mmetsp:Transcript_6556/g.17582  ORF Transcript_6556/g.17582 Transcript_6556/m.17582 type:complete len:450 (+) Transcript_6556:227-1576(+)